MFYTREDVHVFISDITRKRRTKYVQNIRLLRGKDASWDRFSVILNLEKKRKSIKHETKKNMFLV